MLTVDIIKKEYATARDDIVEALVKRQKMLAEEYGINTNLRLAHFLAQTAHESGGFRFTKENLNYSATGLLQVFPKYFRDGKHNAANYHRQPEKIANVVYASRMGNGNEASGDGWRYRGRGLIQLTGKTNYTAFAEDNNMSVSEAIAYLETADGAVESAAWYWAKAGLNALADKDNVAAITKKINGGTNGLQDRQLHTIHFKKLLGVH